MNYVDKISINGVAHEIRDTEARKQIAQNADAINALAERVDSTPPQKNDDQVTQTGAVVAVDVSAGVEIKVDGDTTETVTLIHQGKNFLPSGLENAPTKTEMGITATANADGTTTLNGAPTGVFEYYFMNSAFNTSRIFPAGKYTVSCKVVGGSESYVELFVVALTATGGWSQNRVTAYTGGVNAVSAVLELTEPSSLLAKLGVSTNHVYSDCVVACQIEMGDSETEYEKFAATEYSATLPITVSAYEGKNILYTKTGDTITASYRGDEADSTLEEVKKLIKFDPTPYGLPVLYLNGSISGMTKSNPVTLNYEFEGKSGSLTCKWQGNSSLTFPKKNYTLNFDSAFEAADGWGAQTKYCMKANHNDFTQARNVVSAKLWGQIVAKRTPANATLAACPNYGAIDGFPVVIVLNGEFHGVYCFNIPKDEWMMNMGNGMNECILCADYHVPATKFEGEAALDGTDFEVEYVTDATNMDWVKTSLNNMLNACANSDGSDLDSTIASMLDWQSVIDYYIFSALICNTDGISKNYLLSTYDGTKWFFGAYDMDTVFGNSWNGNTFISPMLNSTFADIAAKNHVFELVKTYKKDALKARYAELRKSVLSEANVMTAFTSFVGKISRTLFDEESRKYPTEPYTATNTVDSLVNWYRLRCQMIDAEIETMS